MRAVLDANVLFPTILREILTDVAAAGVYQPLWSPRILDEWRHVAAHSGPDIASVAGAEIALLQDRFPDACVDPAGIVLALDLPDPADAHVVEAALAGRAGLIVTANLRDFPRGLMAGLGLRAVHPDAFLLDLDPAAVRYAAQTARDKAARLGGEMDLTGMLKKARLPRLARALKG